VAQRCRTVERTCTIDFSGRGGIASDPLTAFPRAPGAPEEAARSQRWTLSEAYEFCWKTAGIQRKGNRLFLCIINFNKFTNINTN